MIKLGEIYQNETSYGLVVNAGEKKFALVDITPNGRYFISTAPRGLIYQPVQTRTELAKILHKNGWRRLCHIYDALYTRPDSAVIRDFEGWV